MTTLQMTNLTGSTQIGTGNTPPATNIFATGTTEREAGRSSISGRSSPDDETDDPEPNRIPADHR